MKIYTVNRNNMGFGISTTPVKSFKEEIDAILYKEELENKKDKGYIGLFYNSFYSIDEMEYEESPQRDLKKARKWAESKVKELDAEMLKNAEQQDKENKDLIEKNERLAIRKQEISKYL